MNKNTYPISILDGIYSPILVTDVTMQITYANPAIERIANHKISKFTELNLKDLISDDSCKKIFSIFKNNKNNTNEIELMLKNGRRISATIQDLSDDEMMICFYETRTSLQYEKVLKELGDISYNKNLSLSEKISQALEMGLKFYHLDTAIIAEINEDEGAYLIRYTFPISKEFRAGMSLKLQETYCQYTFKENKIFSFSEIAEIENLDKHPCYQKFKIEAYIGIPLVINNEKYGALAFFSKKVRKPNFSKEDFDFIELLKDWIEHELSRARYIAKIEAIKKELEAANKELKFLANYDQLTNLANRTLLFEGLNKMLASAKRYGNNNGAILFIDIDNFKAINDQYGHDAGDAALIFTAENLKKSFRESDIVSRYGGDEFAVVLTNINNQEECKKSIEKLLGLFYEKLVFKNQKIVIELSIGVAFFPEQGTDSSILLNKADQAMYKAKNSNDIFYFSSNK